MGATGNTTHPDDDSVEAQGRPQSWLRWVFPEPSVVLLEHGLVIGRDADCGIRLQGRGVSRRHAELHRQGPIFALRDLGSTNGVFLNGRSVQHGPVSPRSVLRIGEHVGVFDEHVGAPAKFREIATGLFGGGEMEAALAPALRAAKSDISILVIGATGTGKELVARAIHEFSGRKGSLHALNCAALPSELAEAELFGYRKGAFTGAERPSVGHFRAADRGTLFLDEIADLPLPLQAKLLRVVAEGAVSPLGETATVRVDVRVVAAAQHSLRDSVAAQRFREDLYVRLAGLTVVLPALRDRPADVAQLFMHFVDEYSGGRPPKIDSKLIERLCLHDWPGNVRELEQLARRLLAVHGLEPVLRLSFVPSTSFSQALHERDSSVPPNAELVDRREHDIQQLALALRRTQGKVGLAAALLGFSRQRAYRLLAGRSTDEFLAEELPKNGSASGGEIS
jgi:transcriptional regulator with PAS, ATPase and Fis domain